MSLGALAATPARVRGPFVVNAASPDVGPRFGCAGVDAFAPSGSGDGRSETAADARPSILRRAFMAPINAYQWLTQNTLYRWMGNRGFDLCLYRKNGMFSCSEYTKLAIAEYGPFKGILAGAQRILSCNPVQGWLVEKRGKPLFDPLQVHGSYAQARVSAPDFLNRTRRGRWYFDNIDANGLPTSRARVSGAVG